MLFHGVVEICVFRRRSLTRRAVLLKRECGQMRKVFPPGGKARVVFTDTTHLEVSVGRVCKHTTE